MVTLTMAREPRMIAENFNGNDDLFIGNDGYALSKLVSATLSSQEDLSQFFEIMEGFHSELPQLEINSSNTRLDKYLFYYSSKL